MAYTTKSGDTWDMIAKEVYGDEYHADVLMAANPQHIDTFIFGSGVDEQDAKHTSSNVANRE